ncbi:MAG: 50S ribosomal protein P1 [Acidilobaceae archaeon]
MAQVARAYLHAALALHYAGKKITEENLRSVIEALGLSVDDVRVKMLVASLSEINLDEVLKHASTAASVAAPVAAPAATSVAVEQPKEEKKEEEKKEEEVDLSAGLESLFGF